MNEKHPANHSALRRATEAQRLRNALAQVIDEEAIADWMAMPNPAFDGLKPLELLERGETDRLWRMVHMLHAGMPS